MDMLEYNDERQSTPTCFKLECNHAFHTKCIIEVLSKTQHKCPSCNKHKSPEEQIERAGVIRNLLKEIKKDDRVRQAKHEYSSVTKEYSEKLSGLKKELKTWARKRAEEVGLHDDKKKWLSSIAGVKKAARQVASEKGFKYTGAMEADDRINNRRWGITTAEAAIFGKSARIHDYRLKYPRVWSTL
jgi:plasmid stability protein